jgi:uncharacterized membrane protein YuzA (DUF378 family)
MAKNALDWIALILVIIGAINWGLVGLGDWNIIDLIFGSIPVLVKLIYVIVGLAGLYTIYFISKK